jgi:cell division protein FtsB
MTCMEFPIDLSSGEIVGYITGADLVFTSVEEMNSKQKFVSYHMFTKWLKQLAAEIEELKQRIKTLEEENNG